MSVVTKDTIQPSSGQALTIKDEGGTASITVATNGEATFAENVILTANKGLSFQNNSVTSATGASSTTSDNVLDDYEEGTWTPTTGASNESASGTYIKIGKLVFIQGIYAQTGSGSGGNNYIIEDCLPFVSGGSGQSGFCSTAYFYNTATGKTTFNGYIEGGSDDIKWYSYDGTVTDNRVQNALFQANVRFDFSGVYRTA